MVKSSKSLVNTACKKKSCGNALGGNPLNALLRIQWFNNNKEKIGWTARQKRHWWVQYIRNSWCAWSLTRYNVHKVEFSIHSDKDEIGARYWILNTGYWINSKRIYGYKNNHWYYGIYYYALAQLILVPISIRRPTFSISGICCTFLESLYVF